MGANWDWMFIQRQIEKSTQDHDHFSLDREYTAHYRPPSPLKETHAVQLCIATNQVDNMWRWDMNGLYTCWYSVPTTISNKSLIIVVNWGTKRLGRSSDTTFWPFMLTSSEVEYQLHMYSLNGLRQVGVVCTTKTRYFWQWHMYTDKKRVFTWPSPVTCLGPLVCSTVSHSLSY